MTINQTGIAEASPIASLYVLPLNAMKGHLPIMKTVPLAGVSNHLPFQMSKLPDSEIYAQLDEPTIVFTPHARPARRWLCIEHRARGACGH